MNKTTARLLYYFVYIPVLTVWTIGIIIWAWAEDTATIIINTHRLMPRPVAIFSIVANLLLLFFTSWYPWLCLYWYGLSFVGYVLSSRYRHIYDITLTTQEELLDE